MAKTDPGQWPPGGESPEGDSIAGQLVSRFDKVSPTPGDALDWAAIAARYEREAAVLGDRARAAELLFEAGRVFEERLHDPQVALDFYRRAFAAGRQFLPNLRALCRLAVELGETAVAEEALAAEAERTGDPASPLGDAPLPEHAPAAPPSAAAPLAPAAPASRSSPAPPLVAALADAEAAARAGDEAGLLAAYLRCADLADDRRVAGHYLLSASGVAAEGLGDLDRAGALAQTAFARCPDDPLIRGAARLHASRSGDLLGLAEVLRADAAHTPDAEAARALTELARVEERLGHGDRAVASLEQAWTLAPDDPRVITELARLREARREWDAASDALEALAAAHLAHGGPGHRLEAVAAKLRRIEVEEVHLGRREEAVRSCRDVLELDPAQRTALAAMGRLCAGAGDWEGVLTTFRAEAAAARDPRERAQRLFRAAQVLDEHLDRTAEAALAYRAAMAEDLDLLVARTALERLLERDGRWEELCQLLEADLGAGASTGEEIDALLRLARIEDERRGDPAAAARRYRRILELDPGNPSARRLLRATLDRQGAGAELAEVLREEAERAGPRRRLAFLQRRAEVLEEQVRDGAQAIDAWEEIRALEPHHLPALRALGRLHAGAARWEAVASLFRAQAETTTDPVQAAELLLRAAELFERQLGQPEAAITIYRDVLALQPAHLAALQALSRLLRARGEHEALAEILAALAATREAPAERAAALTDLGELCEERLHDRPRALEAYEAALTADPACVAALRAAERLYLDLDRKDALEALRRAALADVQARDRVERLLRLAWQEADRNRRPEATLAVADALSEVLPGNPTSAILALRAGDPVRRERALRVLSPASIAAAAADPAPGAGAAPAAAPQPPAAEPVVEEGDQARLARISEERMKTAGDAGSRAAWAVQAGEAWERAGEGERALSAYQAALTAAPSHLPALRNARNLFAQRRDWGAVRATLQAEAETLLDGHEAAAAWREAGAIAEQWFGDVEGAVNDYRAALERDPSDPVALTRVEALLAERGLAVLAEVHAARARAETDPHRSAEAWLAAARSAQESRDGRGSALGYLDEALGRRPDLPAALELRARLRIASGQLSLGLADLEACLALGGEPATQVPLHLAASALCEEKLLDPEGALRHAEAALALLPESAEALARLARIHKAAGRLPAAAAALRKVVATGLPREPMLEHGYALALLEAELGEHDAAVETVRRLLDLDPGHPGALQLQVELERHRGDARQLVAALDAAAESARDAAARGDAHLEAARLMAASPANRAQALEHLRAALDLDPERDDVRAAMADVAEDPHPAMALDQHRRLLARDPARVASWNALYRIFTRLRSHDGAFVAASVLRWLGALSPGPGADQLLLEGDRQTLAPPPTLAADDFERLRAPGDRGPLADLVAAAGDVLATVLVDPRETRGAPVRADHPFRRVLAELARALGAGSFELYAAPLGRLTVEPGNPPAVCVGADLAHRSTIREQRFMLGRAAARLRTRSALVEAFPGDFPDAVGAAIRLVVPGYAGLGTPGDDLSRRLERAASRKVRRALEEPARALALRSAPDLAAWRAAAATTADRAGLVLAGDVPTALDLLLRDDSGRKPAPGDRIAALRARPEAMALLAFAAGEAHLSLRQKLRVAIA